MKQGTFLLIGDDYIANYNWQKRIPFFSVHCFGTKGETVAGLLSRIGNIEKQVQAPDIILLMTGINNVIAEDYTFVDQIRRVVIRLSNRFPEAEIIVNSLPNFPAKFLVEDAIRHLNTHLSDMARQTGCCYLDNFEVSAQKNMNLFKKNSIQLTRQAYDRWARSFLEFVAFLLEDD